MSYRAVHMRKTIKRVAGFPRTATYRAVGMRSVIQTIAGSDHPGDPRIGSDRMGRTSEQRR